MLMFGKVAALAAVEKPMVVGATSWLVCARAEQHSTAQHSTERIRLDWIGSEDSEQVSRWLFVARSSVEAISLSLSLSASFLFLPFLTPKHLSFLPSCSIFPRISHNLPLLAAPLATALSPAANKVCERVGRYKVAALVSWLNLWKRWRLLQVSVSCFVLSGSTLEVRLFWNCKIGNRVTKCETSKWKSTLCCKQAFARFILRR